MRFCELVVAKCRNLKFLKVTTTPMPANYSHNEQQSAFTALTNDLKRRNITFSYDYDEHLHDRQIM